MSLRFYVVAGYTSVLCAAFVPSHALSQAPSAFPMNPGAPAAADARDAGFAAWVATGAAATVTAPTIVNASRYRLLVQSAVARQSQPGTDVLARVLVSCARPLGASDEAVRRATTERAWSSADALVQDRPLVAITIVPVEARPVGCEDEAVDTLALAFAIGFGRDTTGHPSADAVSTRVLVGRDTVTPILVVRAPMTKFAPGGYVGPDGRHALRVYLAFETLVTRDTTTPSITLDIWNPTDSLPLRAELPSGLVRRLWRELLPWRLRRGAQAASTTRSLPVPLLEPSDATLREAYQSYLSGAFTDGAARALARGEARRLSATDRAIAGLQVGVTLAALGDDPAARAVMREALANEPCALLPATVPSELRAPFDAVRPSAARCVPAPASRVLRYGLVPGLAQRRLEPHRREAGLYPLLGTAGAAGLWAYFSAKASSDHSKYLATANEPAAAFADAERARQIANAAAVGIWLGWGGSVVHAVLRERRLGQRVERWQAASSRPLPGRQSSVAPASRGIGLTVAFF